ncbi:MAG: helix-turn-helix domain-containing protein [Verrucomicrobiae bacterium]|nr:helix-turn-helix domain-containing protein [Verrucomicrobiae bacterium]
MQIAHAVSRSRATVQSWFDRYRRGGLEALLADGRLGNPGGPASRLTPVVAEALQEALAAGQFRTGPRARRWLAEAHGVDVALATVYTYLGKPGRGCGSRAQYRRRRIPWRPPASRRS